MSSIIRQIVESDSMVRRLKGERRRPFRRPKRQLLPDGATRAYRAQLIANLEAVKRIVDGGLVARLGELERLAATRADAERTDIGAVAAAIKAIFDFIRSSIAGEPESQAETAARETAQFNLGQVREQMAGVLGVDVFFGEPRLQDLLDDFAAVNVRLIESIPGQYLDQVEALVRRGLRSGRRAASLAEEIEERFKVAKSRAKLIARDQIAKLNANLTRDRQQALGVEKYIWRTSRDERVRPTHARLEGTEHSWDDPPSVGGGRREHPGGDFACRCTAEPVIPGAEPSPRTSPADVPPPNPRRRRRR